MEIGSEFWNVFPQKIYREFFLSGRTALEFIIRDIIKKYNVTYVLLPSYCCHTMIEPFVRHGFKIRFYDVVIDLMGGLRVKIPDSQDNEIFYYMSYFGYNEIHGMDNKFIQEKFSVIIKDCTHSWMSNTNHFQADYSFISYRKWNGYSGLAEARANKEPFCIKSENRIHEQYIQIREKASDLKKEYIKAENGKKEEYLELYQKAEKILDKDYIDYRPSYRAICEFWRTDWKCVKTIRKRNAEELLKGLKDIDEVQVLYKEVSKEDVPLFVPIIVSHKRDSLYQYLIKHQIYSPIHWPLSKLHRNLSTNAKRIYDYELSLICDQRYDIDDMKRIVDVVKNYYL